MEIATKKNYLVFMILVLSLFGSYTAQPSLLKSPEKLVAMAPAGWHIGHSEQQGEIYQVIEYVPPGETVYHWTRMLTVQILSGQHNNIDDFMAEVVAIRRVDCPDIVTDTAIHIGHANNYLVGMLWVGCPHFPNTEDSEFTIYYSHKGHDALYVVQQTWRKPAFKYQQVLLSYAEWTEWITFLQSTFVCNFLDQQHPCNRATPVFTYHH